MAQPASMDPSNPQHDSSWTGRVFLVQLSLDACPSTGHFRGRVQHLRSCDAAHFESLEQLARFMGMRVDDPRAATGSPSGDGDASRP